jgi:hypothetical protein
MGRYVPCGACTSINLQLVSLHPGHAYQNELVATEILGTFSISSLS